MLVHQDLIVWEMETSWEVIIHCAHWDEVSNPVANQEITIGDRVLRVEASIHCLSDACP